jgi:glycosyltransferase involved in cell wall biosynthesis
MFCFSHFYWYGLVIISDNCFFVLRVFVIYSNTGIGTHSARVAASLTAASLAKLTVEVVDALNQDALADAISRSAPSDINLFFLAEDYCHQVRGTTLYWSVFEASRPPPQYTKWTEIFDYLVCASQWSASRFEHYGVPSGMLTVIPEGVDSDTYNPVGRTTDSDKKRFLMVGKYERRKGYLEAFHAFDLAWQHNKNIELHVKADWISPSGSQQHPGFLQLAGEFSHLPIIVYDGVASVEQMKALYQSADYFLFPSLGEGWGLPLIEAIACGCYAITCNYSGQSEFLKDIEGLYASIPYQLIPVDCPDFLRAYSHADGDNGQWAQPAVAALAEIIATCARSSFSDEALVASEIIRRRYHWDNAGYSLIKFLLTRVLPRVIASGGKPVSNLDIVD